MGSLKGPFESREEAVKLLTTPLHDAFRKLAGIQKCGVLFSGGLDSSLAAVMTSEYCDETILFSSFAPSSHDQRFASMAADLLGMQLVQVKMTAEEVWSVLPELISILKSCKRIDIEIALPFFFATREACYWGISDLVSAQGPDALFGGYARHIELMREQGPEILDEHLKKETSDIYTTDIDRDTQVITAFGVTPHFPFLDEKFIEQALQVSSDLKVNPNLTPARKIILRDLAQKNGVPDRLARAPKMATQYSSGSAKLLMKAIQNHVSDAKNWGRKRISSRVQDVLDVIGGKIGVRSVRTKQRISIDMAAVEQWLEKSSD
jgi:asparagine synthase (glutamine-hydrolysing)